MRLVILLPAAGIDADRAAAWLDQQRPGLARDFFAEVERFLSLIAHYPECCQRFRGPLRRGFLRRFDYAVVYRIGKNAIEIIAIVHCRRSNAQLARGQSALPE